MKQILLFIFILLIFTACGKKYTLFSQNQDLVKTIKLDPNKEIYKYKIKPYDRISVLFYDHPDLSTRKIGDFQEDTVGILVNADGIASFPLIGDIQIAGMYVEDLEKKIEELASEFIINPSVNLNIINHRLFVLGEVNNPGTIKITNTTMNLFEAISSSGGLRDTSDKNEVLIIRGDLSNPELMKVDITDFKSLTTSSLILHPYDILYVNPNKAKNFNTNINELLPFIQLIESATSSGVNTKTLN
jgi:polysaccharide biosynthesis/export protein